jgi:hypothetical protein
MMNGELVPVLLTCSLGACTPAAHSTARSGARAPRRLCHHRKPLQLRRRGSLLRRGSHRDDGTAIACAARSDRCRRRPGSGSRVLLRLLSGEAGMRVIDVSQIDGNIRKVIDRYAAAPNITVPQTFRQALTRRRQSRGLATSVSRPGWSESRIATSRRSSRCPSRVREGP